jgi:hypothetical protein
MKGGYFSHSFAVIAAIGFGLAMLAPVVVPLIQTANAQTSGPQLFITWRALNSYAPAGYPGKILPNQTSQIAASLQVTNNGKPVDLSGQTVYWYQNDNLLGGGIGTQRFTFRPYGEAPNTITLKVELPDYPGGLLIHEINIPIVQPQAIIEAPYPRGNLTTNSAMVQALPYFFATSSTAPLTFTWAVNGQTVTSAENPQSLKISLPQSTPVGYGVAVTLTVQNSADSTSASASANLIYQ